MNDRNRPSQRIDVLHVGPARIATACRRVVDLAGDEPAYAGIVALASLVAEAALPLVHDDEVPADASDAPKVNRSDLRLGVNGAVKDLRMAVAAEALPGDATEKSRLAVRVKNYLATTWKGFHNATADEAEALARAFLKDLKAQAVTDLVAQSDAVRSARDRLQAAADALEAGNRRRRASGDARSPITEEELHDRFCLLVGRILDATYGVPDETERLMEPVEDTEDERRAERRGPGEPEEA